MNKTRIAKLDTKTTYPEKITALEDQLEKWEVDQWTKQGQPIKKWGCSGLKDVPFLSNE